jgi:hypothetical protein
VYRNKTQEILHDAVGAFRFGNRPKSWNPGASAFSVSSPTATWSSSSLSEDEEDPPPGVSWTLIMLPNVVSRKLWSAS